MGTVRELGFASYFSNELGRVSFALVYRTIVLVTTPSTGDPWDANTSMINRRLKVYRFTRRVAKPREHISFCVH